MNMHQKRMRESFDHGDRLDCATAAVKAAEKTVSNVARRFHIPVLTIVGLGYLSSALHVVGFFYDKVLANDDLIVLVNGSLLRHGECVETRGGGIGGFVELVRWR